MKDLDTFYFEQEEPTRGTLWALRDIVLQQDQNITHVLKYGMPFFCYKGKMFCYFWYHKKYKQPYIGIVEGNRLDEPFLLQEKRSRMKIMLIDPNQDLPIDTLKSVLQKTLDLYRS